MGAASQQSMLLIDDNRVLASPLADILAYLVNYSTLNDPQAIIALASHYILAVSRSNLVGTMHTNLESEEVRTMHAHRHKRSNLGVVRTKLAGSSIWSQPNLCANLNRIASLVCLIGSGM